MLTSILLVSYKSKAIYNIIYSLNYIGLFFQPFRQSIL